MKPIDNGFLAIEIGMNSIRLLQYNSSENSIDSVGINPIDPKDAQNMQAMEDEIVNLINGSEAKSRNVITCVNGQNMICKRFFVDADEKDFNGFLKWEMEQQLLCSIDQFIIEFQEISGSTAKGMREFLAVAYRREYVDRIARMMYRIKLNPILVDVDIFALQNVFEANYPEAVDKVNLLVFLDGIRMYVVLCKDRMILDYEVLLKSPKEQNINVSDWIAKEIQNFLSLSADHNILPLNGIWVGGEISKDSEIIQALKTGNMGVAVDVLNPFIKIKIREDLSMQMKNITPLCSIVAGLVLRGTGE